MPHTAHIIVCIHITHINLNIKIPYSDFKQQINSYFINKWQVKWNNVAFNKLRPIKKTLGETNLKNIINRRDEVVLHRARCGHTYLIHCYLIKGEEILNVSPVNHL